jgi:putative component of membrane protein insertase Oxa1/YidC/SpoIIIJ protein YidD
MSRTQTFLILTRWIEVLINSFELYKNRSIHFWNLLISACLKRHDDYSMTCSSFFEDIICLSFNSFENLFFSIKTFLKWHRRSSCEWILKFIWFWIFFRRLFLSWTLKNEIWIRAKTYHSLFVNLLISSRLISNVICTRDVDR